MTLFPSSSANLSEKVSYYKQIAHQHSSTSNAMSLHKQHTYSTDTLYCPINWLYCWNHVLFCLHTENVHICNSHKGRPRSYYTHTYTVLCVFFPICIWQHMTPNTH